MFKFKPGDRVRLTWRPKNEMVASWLMHVHMAGSEGTVIVVSDDMAYGYQVQFDDGHLWWVVEAVLEPVDDHLDTLAQAFGGH